MQSTGCSTLQSPTAAHSIFHELSLTTNNYQYVYEDWTTTETSPRCFYVGKGTFHRTTTLVRNLKHTWVSKHLGQQRRIVFFQTPSDVEASIVEVRLIAAHKTFSTSHHPNQPKSLAHRQKIGIANRRRYDDRRRLGSTQKKHSPETNERRRQTLLRQPPYTAERKLNRRTGKAVATICKLVPRIVFDLMFPVEK